jgi:hypothetical protein
MTTQIKGDATSTFGSDIDVTGSIKHDMPMVYAYRSTIQSITASTWTKVQLDSEQLDATSDFDNSTNYRFTPSVAGWYNFTVQGRLYATSKTVQAIHLYKNGAQTDGIQANDNGSQGNFEHLSATGLVYANGSTDYFEMYAYITGTSPSVRGSYSNTYMSAFLVRAD